MPISGLVITFERSNESQSEIVSQLRSEPTIEIGAIDSYKCAIVVDTDSKAEDKKIFEWVQDLPGVANVQIAFVGFEDEIVDPHH